MRMLFLAVQLPSYPDRLSHELCAQSPKLQAHAAAAGHSSELTRKHRDTRQGPYVVSVCDIKLHSTFSDVAAASLQRTHLTSRPQLSISQVTGKGWDALNQDRLMASSGRIQQDRTL